MRRTRLFTHRVRRGILSARVILATPPLLLFGIKELFASEDRTKRTAQLCEMIAQNARTDASHAEAAASRPVTVTFWATETWKLSTALQAEESKEICAILAVVAVT